MNKEKLIADYLVKSYESITDTVFGSSELKLQKLMYFAQKLSLAFRNDELFEEQFEGWVHGPVLTSLRGYFDYYNPDESDIESLSDIEKYIVDNAIYEYGQYATWTLREMSHDEYSWKKSREGLSDGLPGYKKIELDDIRKDAEKIRLYDHQFDMYIDEFEDLEEEVSLG